MALLDGLFDPGDYGGGILSGLRGRLLDEIQPGVMSYAPAAMGQGVLPSMQQPQAAPPSPQMPAAAPQQSGMPDLSALSGIGDRLGAGALGFLNSGSPLQAIGALMQGLATGKRADPMGMALDQQNAMFHFLVKQGTPPDQASIIAQNPKAQELFISQMVQPKQKFQQIGEDMFGGKQFGLVNETQGTVSPYQPGASGAIGAAGTGGGSDFLAKGISQVDSSLTGDAYLKQFSPEIQASVKDYIEGKSMPTGNPRKGFTQAVKMIAQKYGNDIGMAADDSAFAERRKMRTDLAASSNNSMGGILSNGKSAFEHLLNLSNKFADLGNYNGPNIPGGGHIASVENYAGNAIAPTSETKGKIQAAEDNALKYGQEATKFYAGSGGGEQERLMALRSLNARTTSGTEQAAFLQTEKELMLGRLKQKEDQIRSTLGQQFLDTHPVMTPDLQATLGKIDANIRKLRGETAGNVTSSGVKWSIQ